jgi:hypothetical protein
MGTARQPATTASAARLFAAGGRRTIANEDRRSTHVRPRGPGFDRVAIRRLGPIRTRELRSLEENEDEQGSARQAALNQALSRDVNELRLEQSEEAEVEFVCECSDPSCEEVVSLSTRECDFIRRVPTRLVVKLGHADHETERVLVEEPGRFQVVEKFGPGGDVIAHLDPRGVNRKRSSS